MKNTEALIEQLLSRGPEMSSGARGSRPRRIVRDVVLRVLRPYSAHQHELDHAILTALLGLEDDGGVVGERLRALELALGRQGARIDGLGRLADDLVDAAQILNGRLRDIDASPYAAGYPFERFTVEVGDVTGFRGSQLKADDGSGGFEDVFMHSPERVRELQLYVGLVADHQPVLDLSGRGEFLTLLAEHGIEARGIDSDPVSHLEGLDDRTLGTVFSVQLIEHLAAHDVCQLLELACRKLVPGGIMLAETHNPQYSSIFKRSWVDLAQREVFPEIGLALCRVAGFESAYVFAPGYDSFEEARFDASRYAVVATAPGVAGH